MKIIVSDINKEICEEAKLYGYETHCGSITDLKVDAVVSPANSFGFMDGGIDRHYTHFFGDSVQKILQKQISERPMGELLVGEALIIYTENEKIPWLISAPTMRVPKKIHDSFDISLAVKAALLIAKENKIKTIAFPGMGTGVGEVKPKIAVAAFHRAVIDVKNPRDYPTGFMQALRWHYDLSYLEEDE